MARISYYRELLKNNLRGGLTEMRDFLSPEDILTTTEGDCWRDRIWNPVLTFWTFLIQVLHPGSACREAVAMVVAEQAVTSGRHISLDASANCQARKRVPLSVFVSLLHKVGQCLQHTAKDQPLWHGRRIRLVDGSSCSMPDTPKLQSAFGQPDGQKKGCGFPVARIVAMFCWATGAVPDVAIGPYRSSELSPVGPLWGQLKCGDIVLADRFYCTYVILAELLAQG